MSYDIINITIRVTITLNIFSIVLSLRNQSTGLLLRDISDLKSLANSNLYLALAFTVILFSIGGIPPLVGFFSKF